MESCMVCLMFLFQTICLSMRCSCWGGPMPPKPASRVLSRSSWKMRNSVVHKIVGTEKVDAVGITIQLKSLSRTVQIFFLQSTRSNDCFHDCHVKLGCRCHAAHSTVYFWAKRRDWSQEPKITLWVSQYFCCWRSRLSCHRHAFVQNNANRSGNITCRTCSSRVALHIFCLVTSFLLSGVLLANRLRSWRLGW